LTTLFASGSFSGADAVPHGADTVAGDEVLGVEDRNGFESGDADGLGAGMTASGKTAFTAGLAARLFS
jgi:hypothetical protein